MKTENEAPNTPPFGKKVMKSDNKFLFSVQVQNQ